MKLKLKEGTTSKLVRLFIQDSATTDGSGLTGLSNGSSGLVAWYIPEGDAAPVSIVLTAGTVGTYSSGGFSEVDATNMPGIYEFGLPDAVIDDTSEGSTLVMLHGATDMAVCLLEIELDAIDYRDGTRAGLANLDAAMTTRASQVSVDRVEENTGYVLSVLAGAIANADTATETFVITLNAVAYTATFAGLDEDGNRGTTVLSKA